MENLPSIYVLDDEEAITLVIKRQLQNVGIDSKIFNDPIDCLNFCKKTPQNY